MPWPAFTCRLKFAARDRRLPQPLQFLLLDFFRVGVGQFPGMQFDDVGAERHGRIDLFPDRIDEHADANARGVKSLHGSRQFLFVRDEIETAFGRDLLAVLRDEADFIRHESAARNRQSPACSPSRGSAS